MKKMVKKGVFICLFGMLLNGCGKSNTSVSTESLNLDAVEPTFKSSETDLFYDTIFEESNADEKIAISIKGSDLAEPDYYAVFDRKRKRELYPERYDSVLVLDQNGQYVSDFHLHEILEQADISNVEKAILNNSSFCGLFQDALVFCYDEENESQGRVSLYLYDKQTRTVEKIYESKRDFPVQSEVNIRNNCLIIDETYYDSTIKKTSYVETFLQFDEERNMLGSFKSIYSQILESLHDNSYILVETNGFNEGGRSKQTFFEQIENNGALLCQNEIDKNDFFFLHENGDKVALMDFDYTMFDCAYERAGEYWLIRMEGEDGDVLRSYQIGDGTYFDIMIDKNVFYYGKNEEGFLFTDADEGGNLWYLDCKSKKVNKIASSEDLSETKHYSLLGCGYYIVKDRIYFVKQEDDGIRWNTCSLSDPSHEITELPFEFMDINYPSIGSTDTEIFNGICKYCNQVGYSNNCEIFQLNENYEFSSKINQDIKDYFVIIFEDNLKQLQEEEASCYWHDNDFTFIGYIADSYVLMDAEIIGEKYLSLDYRKLSEYSGDMYPYYSDQCGLLYDLANGNRVSIEQLYGKSEEEFYEDFKIEIKKYFDFMDEEVRPAFAKDTEELVDGINYKNRDYGYVPYRFSEAGIEFTFWGSEWGYYGDENYFVTLPYDVFGISL